VIHEQDVQMHNGFAGCADFSLPDVSLGGDS
jgi:hypothetical protein